MANADRDENVSGDGVYSKETHQLYI